MPDSSGRFQWLRAGVGAGALVALLAAGVVDMVRRSGGLLADAGRWGKLSSTEARRRTFGASYTDAVDRIRRDLPDDAWYLLVPPPESAETGWAVWLRYDLAPRRPILIESVGGRGLHTANGTAVPRWVRWAVLPDAPGANSVPRLVTREEAFARLKADGRR